MSNKTFNVITKILAIILSILILANLYIAFFEDVPFEQKMAEVLFSLTALFAIFYIVVGCTKKGAKYYHAFMIAYAITMLIIIFFNRTRAPFSFFFNLIIYGCLCVMASARDL